ncbi:MAG: FimB/Mfa2 family fimbrial subunit [Tannerellaceae bacterium]|jgi:hypothetical protein|nr:FimB/Mfa2 family fimbrial subunit [Tannerellaceae bacterium]
MKHIFSKTKAFLALCIGWAMLTTSCINEYLDDCYTLTLKVVNSSGEDITEGDAVVDAGLYIYDENGKYLETVTLSASQIKSHTPVEINYPATAKLQIVAWGNTEGSEQTVSAGSTISDLTLQLANRTATVLEHPRDLFFGNDEDIPLNAGVLTQNEVVVISPKVGRLQMRTENLERGMELWREQNGLRADEDLTFDFYFNKTSSRVGADGSVAGADEGLSHNPEAMLTEEGEWDMFPLEDGFENVLPGMLQEGVFYVNGRPYETQPIDDITQAEIKVEEDHETIVIFRWTSEGEFLGIDVNIRVIVRPWGDGGDDEPPLTPQR